MIQSKNLPPLWVPAVQLQQETSCSYIPIGSRFPGASTDASHLSRSKGTKRRHSFVRFEPYSRDKKSDETISQIEYSRRHDLAAHFACLRAILPLELFQDTVGTRNNVLRATVAYVRYLQDKMANTEATLVQAVQALGQKDAMIAAINVQLARWISEDTKFQTSTWIMETSIPVSQEVAIHMAPNQMYGEIAGQGNIVLDLSIH